ncbi:MAG: phosphoribosylformylglycinamidine synthase subunit PurQ [Deltaproteobacteria bacterium]|nr:phosphoribosylformylglycinamidine synthase subunit PurQ [Deltaproteobacteria bacterium]
MKWGVVVFPGSNCDQDCVYVLKNIFHQDVETQWHEERTLGKVDAVILPGGFSYGDYLRSGAMAAVSPIMQDVIRFAKCGGLVVGICNGFQILTECELLPGVLLRNASLKFRCEDVSLALSTSREPWQKRFSGKKTVSYPIAHMDGNYFIDNEGLKELQDQDQILFRYVQNPNGSIDRIAGICNAKGNVIGLMPHPERACERILGGEDGKLFFESLL